MEKFMIYYEPITKEEEGDIKSFTYVAEPVENEYKVKVVEEFYSKDGTINKFKIKEMYKNVENIMEAIKTINFDLDIDNSKNEGLVIIKYGDKKIVSNNLDSVSTIIDMFKVKDILTLTAEEFVKMKNLKKLVSI